MIASIINRKIIFCEGKEASLDYLLLNQLIQNMPGNKYTIIPAGSKFTFSTFAEGYFYRNQPDEQKYIIFRDRDFDVEPALDCQLLKLKNQANNTNIFLSYRSCIENYLLDSNLIHNYWEEKYQEKQANPTSKWGHGNSPGVAVISTWIETSCKKLKDYQSIRWALGELLNNNMLRKQLKTTWTGSSGNLPESLKLEDCRIEALKIIEITR